MLALIQSSDCDAYHTSTGVTFTTETNTGAQAVKSVNHQTDNLGTVNGELVIDVVGVDGNDELPASCHLALMDAFNDSYDQIYGVDSMTMVIESEEIVPAVDADANTKATANVSVTRRYQYRTYWVRMCKMMFLLSVSCDDP